MALPAANVLGNPATTTSAFQTAIEDQRQFIEDLVFSNIAGQATAGQVPNLQDMNGACTAGQVPNLEDINGTLTDSQLGHSATVSNHHKVGSIQMHTGIYDANYATFRFENSIPEGFFRTVGPTGSGADYIWPSLDSLPANAGILIVTVHARVNVADGELGEFSIYCAHGDMGTEQSNISGLIFDMTGVGSSSHTLISSAVQAYIPLNSNRVFKIKWYGTNEDYGGLHYRGFVTS